MTNTAELVPPRVGQPHDGDADGAVGHDSGPVAFAPTDAEAGSVSRHADPTTNGGSRQRGGALQPTDAATTARADREHVARDHLVVLGGLMMLDLLPVDRKLVHVIFQVRGIVALLLLGLIGMHAAAALYHHFVRKDDMLTGALPGLHRRERAALPAPLPRG